MTEKRRTASIIVRKFQGDIEICCSGGAGVLDPIESEGVGGTGGAAEVGEVGSD